MLPKTPGSTPATPQGASGMYLTFDLKVFADEKVDGWKISVKSWNLIRSKSSGDYTIISSLLRNYLERQTTTYSEYVFYIDLADW
jgi:hypothetical protein